MSNEFKSANFSQMEIFPYLLNRICSVSHQRIEKLNTKGLKLAKFVDDYCHLISNIKQQKDIVSQELFLTIGNIEQGQNSDLIKRFRRDIYNERVTHLPDQIAEQLDAKIRKVVLNYLALIHAKQVTMDLIEIQYEKTRINNSHAIRKIVSKNQIFQKGVLLSSMPLFAEIKKYSNIEKSHLKKKDQNTELSFLKYLSRTCSKTSPFSTFTSLSVSEVDETPKIKKDGITLTSHIRLNNQIFKYLRGILSRYGSFKQHLYLELNPTLEDAEYYDYLINHNNLESLQRIPKDELIVFLVSALGKRKRPLTFTKVKSMISDLTGENDNSVERYLDRLIESGLLNFDFQVSGLDPDWDLKFIKILKEKEKIGVVGLSDLIRGLSSLRANCKRYTKASVSLRVKILDESFTILKDVCKKLYVLAELPLSGLKAFGDTNAEENSEVKVASEDVGRVSNQQFRKLESLYFGFKPEQVFYEDTTTNITFSFPSDVLGKLASDLNNLYNHLEDLDFGHFYKNVNLKLYRKMLNGSISNMSFLDFYKEFFKKYQSVFDNKPDQRQVEKKIKSKSWFKKISNSSNWTFTDHNEFDLTPIFPFKARKKRDGEANSHGVFMQPFYDKNGGLQFVVNSSLSGHGKWFSRFLHLFDEKVTQELQLRNTPKQSEDIRLEITDASFFNANIHPTLMPFESRIPGGNNFLPKNNQILISDIVVRLNEENKELYLYHKKEQRRVKVFDLCFQGINGRSNLYQLLSRFSTNEEYNLHYICMEANKKTVFRNQNDVLVFPRLRLGNIILQRKYWVVPSASIPLRSGSESDAEYYVKVNIWRKELQMPNEIFLRVSERNFQREKVNNKAGKDDYKPQYISFENPLFVLLFEKNVKKAKDNIRIEEMLPSSKELMTFNKKKYVSEFLVQWYN